MDLPGQFLREQVINHPVPGHPRLALEGRRNHGQLEVAFAVSVMAAMTEMARRVVADDQTGGRQRLGQLASDAGRWCHGLPLAWESGIRTDQRDHQEVGPAQARRQATRRLSAARSAVIIGPMRKPDVQVLSYAAGESPAFRVCDCPGCVAAGDYPAPKARDRLREYFWFCLDHVREYNRAWDFYAGMSAAEIESEMRADSTWQRPTWPLGSWRLYEQRLRDQVHGEDGVPFGRAGGAGSGNGDADARRPPQSPEDKARRVLDLEPEASFAEIKARYRELVKKHHPDANGGDKAAEEQLKRINEAYTTLKASAGFTHGR